MTGLALVSSSEYLSNGHGTGQASLEQHQESKSFISFSWWSRQYSGIHSHCFSTGFLCLLSIFSNLAQTPLSSQTAWTQIQLGSIASVDVQVQLTQLFCGRKQHSGAEFDYNSVSWHSNKSPAGCLTLRGLAVQRGHAPGYYIPSFKREMCVWFTRKATYQRREHLSEDNTIWAIRLDLSSKKFCLWILPAQILECVNKIWFLLDI